MELYPIDIAIHLVNIVVLYLLLRLLVWKPVRKFMAQRENRIQEQMDQAEQMQAQAKQQRDDYDSRLAQAQATCEQLLADGRKQAQAAEQRILDEAKAEADKIVAQARTEAREEKLRTMDDAKEELVELAVELAGRVLRFDEETRRRVAQGREDRQGTRQGVLKTAVEIGTAELNTITEQLEQLLGCRLELEAQVDPDLVGGYAAYVDGKVYDFSYAAQLTAMKQKLA